MHSLNRQSRPANQVDLSPLGNHVDPASNTGNLTAERSTHSNNLKYNFGNMSLLAKASATPRPQFAISAPGDKYEMEADATADKVMRTPSNRHATRGGATAGNILHRKESGGGGAHVSKAVHQTLQSPGQAMDAATQSFMGNRFGHDFSNVKIHNDPQAHQSAKDVNALAYTHGNDIVFDRGQYHPETEDGQKLLAHELAHVVNHAPNGIMRKVAPNYSKITDDLSYGAFDWAITEAEAHEVLTILTALNPTDQNDTLEKMKVDGLFERLRTHLNAADLAIFEQLIERVRLQQIQRSGTLAYAATQGMANQGAMAQKQANFMTAQNTAAATAAAGGAAPTPAQVAAQQTNTVAQTSIPAQAAVLTAAQEAAQNTAATAAVGVFIGWVTGAHPELKITAAQLRVDSRAVFDRGQDVVAFGEPGKAVVGKPFADVVAKNPAYALAVIVHELQGHPNYGAYGQPGIELGLELYDQSAALMPGYTQPTGKARTSELDAYGYQETEIYSLMISVPYYTPNTAADDPALKDLNFDPVSTISTRIGLIKQQFEPGVAKSLIRGLVRRFRADSKVTLQSYQAFTQGVRNNFTPAEVATLLAP